MKHCRAGAHHFLTLSFHRRYVEECLAVSRSKKYLFSELCMIIHSIDLSVFREFINLDKRFKVKIFEILVISPDSGRNRMMLL